MITLSTKDQFVWCYPDTIVRDTELASARPINLDSEGRMLFYVEKQPLHAKEVGLTSVTHEASMAKLLGHIEGWLSGREWITGDQVAALVLGGTYPPGTKWTMGYGYDISRKMHPYDLCGELRKSMFILSHYYPTPSGVL